MVSIILSNLCILMMFTYLGYSIFPLRYKDIRINVSLFIICYMFACFININGASASGLILLCILHFVYFFIIFQGKLSNYLLALIPFPLIIVISEFFTANFLNIITNINPKVNINSFLFTCANILSNFLTFLILLIYIKISKLFIKVKLPNLTWMIFILPISSFILLFRINKINIYLLKNDELLFLSIMGVFISNFIVLYIFYKVILSFEYKQKLEKSNNKEKLTNLKYELMNNHYNANFNFLHDLLNKCNDLNTQLVNKDYENALVELDSLYNYSYQEFNAIYSNSLILNYMIVERLEILDKYKIIIKSVIEYNDFQFLSLNEQNILFSSLLDYAIAEIKNVPEPRTLIIKTSKKEYQIIIQVNFSSKGDAYEINDKNKLDEILQAHDALFSEKLDKSKGIKSIIIVFPHLNKIDVLLKGMN